jgi:hypothetical protein
MCNLDRQTGLSDTAGTDDSKQLWQCQPIQEKLNIGFTPEELGPRR